MRRAALLLISVLSLFATVAARAQTPMTTAFTYQGELASDGTPATGTYDIRYRLYDAASDGTQVGSTLCSDNQAITNGRFTTSLDFGSAAFAGQKRFLEIEVRQDAGLDCADATGFTLLAPRQELTAAPNATFAQAAATATTALTASNAASLNGQSPSFYQNAANLTGTLPSARLSGTYTGPLTLSNPSNIFTGNGAAITNLSATNISTGVLDAARMPSNWAAGGDLGGFYPSPTITPGAVTLGKLDPNVQDVLSKLSSLTTAPNPLDAVAWGNGLAGQLNVPALPPGVTNSAVAAGSFHGLALRSDGTVVAWGNNTQGQLNVPALPPGVTYTAVAGGQYHSLALRSDGTIAAWGDNTFGQLDSPGLPPGVTYTAVVAGTYYSLALRSDGGAVGWGFNPYGQANVPALPPCVSYTAIAAGSNHALALRSDGRVVGWGLSAYGVLDVPVLPRGFTYTAIAAGSLHSLALRSDGEVVAWGDNSQGQLNIPALPLGLTYTGVAAGSNHALALRGTLVAPSLRSTVGLSIGAATPPPAPGGISVAGTSSFVAGVSAAWFAGSGADLTNLNASNISSGTLSDLRLSSNVPRRNAEATAFSGRVVAGTSNPLTTPSTPITAVTDPHQHGLSHTDGTISVSSYVGGSTGGGWIGTFTNHPFSLFVNNDSPSLTCNTNGSVSVIGSLSKGGGSFKIDHPLDPENKYLYHSFVESPDMMNVYNGNITTDADGYATITLPDYFEALNRDFRYQLTVIDESDDMEVFLWAKVVRKIGGNQFTIRSSRSNLEVSWQVTGIRKDAWAEKNRIPNSVDKVGAEKGKLLHPEAFGKHVTQGVHFAPAANGQPGSK